MAFGTARKNETNTGEGGRYAKTFKKGETRIRFLEEYDEWTGYWEHFDQSLGDRGKSFPCTGDRKNCPGCISEVERTKKASKRYLVNALVDGYVDVYKIPGSLMSKVIRRADADGGTLLKRDFVVIKAGEGLQTEYDMDREDRSPMDLEQYQEKIQDHEALLQEMYSDAWGEAPGESAEVNQDPKPARKAAVKKETPKAEKEDIGLPPTKPQENPEGEVELSEDEVRKMSVSQLRALFDQTGIPAPDSNDTTVLADALIKALTE